jgi:histidine triad (HIT) family protein
VARSGGGSQHEQFVAASRNEAGEDVLMSCIFCEIVDGRAVADIVFDDDVAMAFLDRSPLFAGHTLVVPRQHVVTLADLDAALVGPFWLRVQHLSREVPRVLGAQGTFVAVNNVVSQSVAHLHAHVVPRTKGDGLRGFFWPRTKYANGESAAVAGRLREGIEPLTTS